MPSVSEILATHNPAETLRVMLDAARERNLTPAKFQTETHHIVFRSMGGIDEPGNRVELTTTEHVLIHWLEWKCFPEDPKRILAFCAMIKCYNPKVTLKRQKAIAESIALSELFLTDLVQIREHSRRIAAEQARGKKPSAATKLKMSNAQKGKTIFPEQRAKLSFSHANLSQDKRERINAGIRKSKSKTYELIGPSGERVVVTNLKKWTTDMFGKKSGDSNIQRGDFHFGWRLADPAKSEQRKTCRKAEWAKLKHRYGPEYRRALKAQKKRDHASS
jgi:hypothetical protein